MYCVYVLKNSAGRYYTGSTANLEDRLIRHNGNREQATTGKGPWIVVFTEQFETRAEALKRERQVKAYKGGRAFKKMLQEYGGVA